MRSLQYDNTDNSSYPRIDYIFSIILVLLPFLHQYKGIGDVISFGELLLIPFVGLFFVDEIRGRKTRFNRPLLALYLSVVFSIICCCAFPYFDFSSTATMIVRLVFYAILILISRKHFHYDAVSKIYTNIVIAFSVYAIIQYLYHLYTGGHLPIYINYNMLFAPEARAANLSTYFASKSIYRVSSLFLEPGYFVLFSFPALVELAVSKEGKQYLKAIVIALALLLSGSGSGIVGILIILLFAYMSSGERGFRSRLVFILFAAIAVGIVVLSGVASTSLSRATIGNGSFNDRIKNGWLIYTKLPIFHKIVGTGINNASNAMDYYSISTGINMWGMNQAYCASVFSALNGEGIIGFIALLSVIIFYYRKASDMRAKCIVTIFAFILCYEAVLFTYRFAFYLVILDAVVNSQMESTQ